MNQVKYMYIGAGVVTLALAAAILHMLYNDSAEVEIYVTSLLGVCTFFFTIVLAINAYQQNLISKQNIKLQLFDKRYKVFETIVSSSRVVSERNYSNQILSIGLDDPNFINKKVMESVEKMYDAAILSQTLFDKELSAKIFKANNKYKALTDIHFKIIKQHIALTANAEFSELYKALLVATDDAETARIEGELNQKFPTFEPANNHFNSEVAHFNEWVNESGLYKDFDKYLMISELDKV